MEEKVCPICNGKLVLREARRGRNAGSRFYGCENYPRCDYTEDIDDGSDVNEIAKYEDTIIPIEFRARGKFDRYYTKFFDVMAIDDNLLDKALEVDNIYDNLYKLAKWRMDFPMATENYGLDESMRKVFVIAEKILQRGHITRISEKLEDALKQRLCKSEEEVIFDENLFNKMFVGTGASEKLLFDGEGYEKKFYTEIVPTLLGNSFKTFIVPQVYLSSLVRNNVEQAMNQRVDFVLNLPGKKIVVEIDGEEHQIHKDKDNERDSILKANGYDVVRILNEEIRNGYGENIYRLKELVEQVGFPKEIDGKPNMYYNMIKVAHQLQIVIIEAIFGGFLNTDKKINIYVESSNIKIDKELLNECLQLVFNDLSEMLNAIAKLYNIKNSNISIELETDDKQVDNKICISYNDEKLYPLTTFYIQDVYLDATILSELRSSSPQRLGNVSKENVKYFLQYIFRKEDFREGQFEAISRTLKGEDSVVLLPTGHGKSIAFQLASMLLPGITIVIAPIIALMEDQVENLKRAGIDRSIGINSQISDREVKDIIVKTFSKGEYLFSYIAPERFQIKEFRDALRSLTVGQPVALIAVDETHCVSEWGHDFRPSYLNIARTSREFCKSNEMVPPLLALTGTASRNVLKDILRELEIEEFDSIITPNTFDRKELNFQIVKSKSEEKPNALEGILNTIPSKFNMSVQNFYQFNGSDTFCGLVFCPHVNGDFGVVEVCNDIRQLSPSVDYYSGSNDTYTNSKDYNIKKKRTAREFKKNKIQLLVATKAFGMGIDKENVRFTIHYGIPGSIESFYQEAGRAGRNRKKSYNMIIFSEDDVIRNQELLNPSTTIQRVKEITENKDRQHDDDITRALFFHTNSFKGIEEELSYITEIIKAVREIGIRKKCAIIAKNLDIELPATVKRSMEKSEKRKAIEKGIHRLLILGVISDYTIDYSSDEFTIEFSNITKEDIVEKYVSYVSKYNRGVVNSELAKTDNIKHLEYTQFVIEMVKILITFIYEVIEKSRRRALYEIVEMCRNSANGEEIRKRILAYLQTEYSESLEKLLEEGNIGTIEMKNIIESIRSTKDASNVRGEVARYLESIPDHPGLLFLRSISEVLTEQPDIVTMEQNMKAAINNAIERYSIPRREVYEITGYLLAIISEKNLDIYVRLLKSLDITLNDMEFFRELLKILPTKVNDYAALRLLNNVCDEICIKED